MNKLVLPFAMSLLLGMATMTASQAKHSDTHSANCAKFCTATAKRLSKKKGNEALVKQMQDCAKSCSDYASTGKNKEACRDACKACAEACEKSGDASLKACAEKCKSCGQHCTM